MSKKFPACPITCKAFEILILHNYIQKGDDDVSQTRMLTHVLPICTLLAFVEHFSILQVYNDG